MTPEQSDEKDISAQRELAHYSASVNAWITAQLEIGKTVVALSSAAIALLITIAPQDTVKKSKCAFITSLIAFSITVIITLVSWHLSAKSIELDTKKDSKADEIEKIIFCVDWFGRIFFIIGITTLVILGIRSIM